ncbi:YdiU family protein [Asticcacaulis sp. SL142]|uniref:protein adenylyltransferase SelO family protein n=1 Tax=Asticcacaulis sp. SL142 TaxID=2995155 RepID=UPI00226D18F5|nr:YdiU family protein [Asticcacaulis sp. SL142]WAC48557.1 YdiU family protein [Asticcacaulis sp. SL142]
MTYTPDPRLLHSGLDLFDRVKAADFPQTTLRYRNDRAAITVGLEGLNDDAWISHFGRFTPLPDNQPEPLALRYHGHQFRHYNPDLGDGRGFLFAQLRDDQGRLLDLGTKGSGRTPWSRGGDGRLTLKGGVREVLATAYLEALGVPTSRSFSLIETGEALHRGDEPSPTRSSVLVRLLHSHIRFGTFERLTYLNELETMRGLIGFVADNYYPDAAGLEGEDQVARVFDLCVTRTANLVARWMMAGFVHGVLNTDNMNITGESFDYGPYRFLPYYDAYFTAAYFDEGGLYAYGRQVDAVFWNLTQLARCLAQICDGARLIDSLNDFGPRYEAAAREAVLNRLNLKPLKADKDQALVEATFKLQAALHPNPGSFEGVYFDWFGGLISEARALSGPRGQFYTGEIFDTFKNLLSDFEPKDADRLKHPLFAAPEPVSLLIDDIEALWAAIDRDDDWSGFHAKLDEIETYRQALGLAAN